MIFSGKGKIHIKGHKDLTDKDKPLQLTDIEYVYLPLLNMSCTDFEILVNEGDSVKVGQLLAYRKDHFYVPIYSSVSGTVEGIEKRMSPNLIFAQHIKIKNDLKYDKEDKALNYNVDTVKKEDIVEAIKENGITGCGGSGFPTYIKYCAEGIETLLINGVECEPYLTIDYSTIMDNMDDLVKGIQFLMKASSAKKSVIAIKKGKTELFNKLKDSIKDLENVDVVEVPDVYPMGWERTLVKEVFNKTFKKIPAEIGIVVDNSSTVIKIAQALTRGLDFTTSLTVSGDALASPRNVVVPVGTRICDIIERIGGYDEKINEQDKLIIGGPMMGKTVTTDEVAVNSYTNAVTILHNVDLKEKPCLRCSRCVEYCPTGLQSVAIKDAEKAQDVDLLKKLHAEDCVSCGLCSYICPSRIQVTDYTTKGKNRVLNAK